MCSLAELIWLQDGKLKQAYYEDVRLACMVGNLWVSEPQAWSKFDPEKDDEE